MRGKGHILLSLDPKGQRLKFYVYLNSLTLKYSESLNNNNKNKQTKKPRNFSPLRSLAIWFISLQLKFQISFPDLNPGKDKGQHILALFKVLTADINP